MGAIGRAHLMLYEFGALCNSMFGSQILIPAKKTMTSAMLGIVYPCMLAHWRRLRQAFVYF